MHRHLSYSFPWVIHTEAIFKFSPSNVSVVSKLPMKTILLFKNELLVSQCIDEWSTLKRAKVVFDHLQSKLPLPTLLGN